MKRKYILFFMAGIVSIPFWLWGAWLLTPKKKMVLAIIDKTESIKKGRQHMGLTWVLNNEKYTKTHRKLYDVSTDYFGFYPKGKSEFKIRGLERFSSLQLDQLSEDCDVAYYADTYGVYNSDLEEQNNSINKGTGIIYGGMTQHDIDFLQKIKSKKKLIISEYNILESPTSPAIRKQFENTFGLTSSGWTCRYFDSFDPSENKDLPSWIINNYKVRHGGDWPFKEAGLAFVNSTGEIVILEDLVHLNNPLPNISVTPSERNSFHVPDNVKFPFWFDIVIPDTSINKVAATFNIGLNEKGTDELNKHNIPLSIPAIIMHDKSDYQFYYFAGSFCSTNTLSISSSRFKWISAFKRFLYNEDDTLESTSFFWKFYRPLIETILNNYYKKMPSHLGK
ncbi:MAG: hypothetical protein JWR18_295 [Segetibacter sp.]|nr:hypothetical protein [Segetibacter sp.]